MWKYLFAAASLLVLLLAARQVTRAQTAPIAPQEPGVYVLSLANGAVWRVGADVETVSPTQVTWSPDGTLIALAGPAGAQPSGASLLIIEVATGREVSVVLPGPGTADWLRWSPDGSRLAFTFQQFGTPTGLNGLYVLGRGEQVPRQLVPDGGQYAWTPDSPAITALQFLNVGPSGFDQRLVTADVSTGSIVAVILGSIGGMCLQELAWSPDGAYLGFGGPGSAQGCPVPGLWSWEARTGTLRQLVDGWASRPLWTRDGDMLAEFVVSDGESVTRVLGRVRPDGSGHGILVRDIPRSFPPALRPFQAAGDTALYAVLNCDLGAVFVLAPLTSPPRRLSDPAVFAYLPSLSPDGSAVAWGTTHAGGNDLALAPVDGSGARTLLQGAPGLSVVGWSPDSRALVFQVSPVAQPGLPC